MAPFNQRQIGYIQAIAGRQQHTTLTCGQYDEHISSSDIMLKYEFPIGLDPKRVIIGNSSTGTHGETFWKGYADGTGSSSTQRNDAKNLLLRTFFLDAPQLGFDSRDKHRDSKLEGDDFTSLKSNVNGMGIQERFNCFDAPTKGHLDADGTVNNDGDFVRNIVKVPSTERATPDGFLNSTHMTFRFTLPGVVTHATPQSDNANPLGQDHYEFRWIVWRSKRPTMHVDADTDNGHTNLEAIRDGCSFRNASYDLFMGQTGRKRGVIGYTTHPKMDEDDDTAKAPVERYSGYRWQGSTSGGQFVIADATVEGETIDQGLTDIHPVGEEKFTVDDLMTCRLNRDDYVVLKDIRFFLGKEHGKSHFEDKLHWDWNDPIDTPHNNVLTSPTLNNKNYRWNMTLIGTNNNYQNPVELNTMVRWTTKMESG